jgi:plasmid stabilization system protein ParE
MSDSYEIRYLRTAEKDLIDIFEYIKKDNPSAAL